MGILDLVKKLDNLFEFKFKNKKDKIYWEKKFKDLDERELQEAFILTQKEDEKVIEDLEKKGEEDKLRKFLSSEEIKKRVIKKINELREEKAKRAFSDPNVVNLIRKKIDQL
jgi:hypothetical protein